jgi:hypothetical protein
MQDGILLLQHVIRHDDGNAGLVDFLLLARDEGSDAED